MTNDGAVEKLPNEITNLLQHIVRPTGCEEPLTRLHILYPLADFPAGRQTMAVHKGVEKNLIFKTWGGLGDQICAEPTLRFASEKFRKDGCRVSIASFHPQLFSHIEFDDVYDLNKVTPNYELYYPFETIVPPSNMVWQFFGHMLVHCVDFTSMCALRMQLPNHLKEIRLPSIPVEVPDKPFVVIHAGRHWQSKTFPKWFWDGVITGLIARDVLPVLIGANTCDNRGTVDVDPKGCLDLRNKQSVIECISFLKASKVLLTNDSAPLHMAASGEAHIGFVATCKHPDLISHWRNGQFGWRMKNFSKGGIWDVVPYCPNVMNEYTVENVGNDNLLSWLPEPEEMVDWAIARL